MTVLVATAAESDVSWTFRNRSGELAQALVLESSEVGLDGVNQWAVEGESGRWTLDLCWGEGRMGADISPAWSLAGERTYFARTVDPSKDRSEAGRLVLRDPLTGVATPIRPGVRYVVSVLTAVHRCSASVVLEMRAADGKLITSERHAVDPGLRGGMSEEDFDNFCKEIVAPPGATTLGLYVAKGGTERGDDSYLFVVRPCLTETGPARPERALTLSADGLALARSLRRIYRVRLLPPDALLVEDLAELELVLKSGTQRTTLGPLGFRVRRDETLESLQVDDGGIVLAGRSRRAEGGVIQLKVLVDGALNSEVTLPVKEGRFEGQVAAKYRWLDGRDHLVEVRLASTDVPLAHRWLLFGDGLTPWADIQAQTNGSTRFDRNAAAPYHFRAYRAWAEAPEHLRPPIVALHRELLAGRIERGRRECLRFPVSADPQVSVVVSAGESLGAIYHCLCSLLFSHNASRFEVIVADGGSGEISSRLEPLVEGVRFIGGQAGAKAARRAATEIAKSDYVAWLSDDVEATAGWLDRLADVFIDFDRIGLVGARLLQPDGRLARASGGFDSADAPIALGQGESPEDPRFASTVEADWISGDALMGLKSVLLGAATTADDVQLAAGARADGLRVVYSPSATLFLHPAIARGSDSVQPATPSSPASRAKHRRVSRSGGGRPSFRVLFIDRRYPRVDVDAGSYAAFQEIRLLQSLGGKVSFLPRDLAWLDRHTEVLQWMGVECQHAPFAPSFTGYLRASAADYDLIYVNRYKIAAATLPTVRKFAPAVKVALNLADLHFLREMREADAGTPGYDHERALATRAVELAAIEACDLSLSYSDVELELLSGLLGDRAKLAKLPWVVDIAQAPPRSFAQTRDLLFLGGFGHPPNVEAVRMFAQSVMPLIAGKLPGVGLDVVGSSPPPEILALGSKSIRIQGFVPDLEESFDRARIFVAPLLAGAGIKGKVLEAMARGATIVLSPVAAEATGLSDGVDCLIADTPQAWVDAVSRAYDDEALWRRLGDAARDLARSRYGFEAGVGVMREALQSIGIKTGEGMAFRRVRPGGFDV